MTRQEFLGQVLLPLGRLTGDEREAVWQELEEHIEDRMEALLDMGWSEELAEARCLEARICPKGGESGLGYVDVSESVDIRETVGNDVVHIFQVSVGLRDGQKAAEVMACIYDRIPFGIAADQLAARSELKNERGGTGTSRSGSGSWGAAYAKLWTPIEPEDTYVVWEYQAIGGMVRLTVPLPGEGKQ